MSHPLLGFFALKEGVSFEGMHPAFLDDVVKWQMASDYINSVCRARPVITSAHDSAHSQNSVHYKGWAVDVRIRDWAGDARQHSRVIAWLLGACWVVVFEPAKAHIHVQFGQENVRNPKAIQRLGFGRWIE